MLSNVVVKRQLALFGEQSDRHRYELLGDGPDPRDGPRSQGKSVVQIRDAIPSGVHDLSVFEDPDHRTWRVFRIPLGEQLIDPSCQIRLRIRLP